MHPNSIKALASSPGRPNRKGLNALLDQLLGKNAEAAVEFAVLVMKGQIARPARKPGKNEDRSSVALIADVGPTIRESLDAAIWLTEMRNGKAPSGVSLDVSGRVEHEHKVNPVDLSRLTNEQLEAAEKILTAAGVTDVEFTPMALPEGVPDGPED